MGNTVKPQIDDNMPKINGILLSPFPLSNLISNTLERIEKIKSEGNKSALLKALFDIVVKISEVQKDIIFEDWQSVVNSKGLQRMNIRRYYYNIYVLDRMFRNDINLLYAANIEFPSFMQFTIKLNDAFIDLWSKDDILRSNLSLAVCKPDTTTPLFT